MEHIDTRNDEGLLVITMKRGKANAINSAMVEEMSAALEVARGDEAVRAVVLASDRAKFFSGGFDVAEVFAYDRETMAEFFGRFIDLYEGLMKLPKPVVGAISGHAFAGGAVLALACDARVLAEGDFGFALNEVNIGLVVPPGMIRMAIRAVGVNRARKMVLEGRTIKPQEALEMGLACELAAPDSVLDRATEKAREFAAKPPATFGAVKNSFNAVSGLFSDGGDRNNLEGFIGHWFSPESIQHRQALIESLRR
jgi:enoyl-CoA hydratase/carnithine racemase